MFGSANRASKTDLTESVDRKRKTLGSKTLGRLRRGLSKSRERFVGGLERIFSRKEAGRDIWEELEELLISADLGAKITERLLEKLRRQLSSRELQSPDRVMSALREELLDVLGPSSKGLCVDGSPAVFLMLGVNGTGKTTTIGKLAWKFRQEGRRVLLAAADTFRAAASEQLEVWGRRVGADIIKHQPGADPSAVVYDAVSAAVARGADILLVDTAGRLHTKSNLIEELKKIKRVLGKVKPGLPQETLLVLDAYTGQNAIYQAREFHQQLELSGLVITKLDATAKAGALIGIVEEMGLPIKLIGVGEGIEDLQEFNPSAFVKALLEKENG